MACLCDHWATKEYFTHKTCSVLNTGKNWMLARSNSNVVSPTEKYCRKLLVKEKVNKMQETETWSLAEGGSTYCPSGLDWSRLASQCAVGGAHTQKYKYLNNHTIYIIRRRKIMQCVPHHLMCDWDHMSVVCTASLGGEPFCISCVLYILRQVPRPTFISVPNQQSSKVVY